MLQVSGFSGGLLTLQQLVRLLPPIFMEVISASITPNKYFAMSMLYKGQHTMTGERGWLPVRIVSDCYFIYFAFCIRAVWPRTPPFAFVQRRVLRATVFLCKNQVRHKQLA